MVLHSVASTVWQLKNNVQIMNQRVHDLLVLRRRLSCKAGFLVAAGKASRFW